jgi:hypothetical protein
LALARGRKTQAACLGREFYVVEVLLNPMGYSDSEEKRILEALGRGLLEEFPIPRAPVPSRRDSQEYRVA